MTDELIVNVLSNMPNFAGLIIALWFARSQSMRQSETIDAQTRAMSDLMKEIIECYRDKQQ